MKAPRKFSPAVARRMLMVKDRLHARYLVLIDAAAPELAATSSPAVAEKILQHIVDELIAILDAEEAAILGELLTPAKRRVH